jgi:activator of HSP90 ATPase
MDERKHASFTASTVHIENTENTIFTAHDGYISGKNILLERGIKIIQQWRASESDWPENHFSEVVFIFEASAEGCKLKCYHNDVPEKLVDTIKKRWQEYYWQPLAFYLDR